ncbi:MAG: hypothetical protein WCG25_00225 [bacterium]
MYDKACFASLIHLVSGNKTPVFWSVKDIKQNQFSFIEYNNNLFKSVSCI